MATELTFDGIEYNLRTNGKKIEIVERQIGHSIMAEMAQNSGMLSIGSIRQFLMYSLVDSDGKTIAPKEVSKLFDSYLEEEDASLIDIIVAINDCIERDCPFLMKSSRG